MVIVVGELLNRTRCRPRRQYPGPYQPLRTCGDTGSTRWRLRAPTSPYGDGTMDVSDGARSLSPSSRMPLDKWHIRLSGASDSMTTGRLSDLVFTIFSGFDSFPNLIYTVAHMGHAESGDQTRVQRGESVSVWLWDSTRPDIIVLCLDDSGPAKRSEK